jgi:hypothetical protein
MLHEITQGVFVVRLILNVENVSVSIAAAFFDPLSGEHWFLLVPLVLVQALNLLFLVVQFILIFDLNVDSLEVVDSLGSFLGVTFLVLT